MTADHAEGGCGLAEALCRAQHAIPGCIAAALVDLRLGVLLSSAAGDDVSDLLGLTATAMSELFRRSSASAVDDAFLSLKSPAPPSGDSFREIFVVSAKTIHVFQRQERDPDIAFLAICRADANLGMVLARARASLGEIQGAVAQKGPVTSEHPSP
jgi:hypothetical protein